MPRELNSAFRPPLSLRNHLQCAKYGPYFSSDGLPVKIGPGVFSLGEEEEAFRVGGHSNFEGEEGTEFAGGMVQLQISAHRV